MMVEIGRQTLRAEAHALPKYRMNGRKDRRKQNNHQLYSDQDSILTKTPGQKGENGNSCENCYFKRFALNFDDWNIERDDFMKIVHLNEMFYVVEREKGHYKYILADSLPKKTAKKLETISKD